jgi:hypothetical protein
MFVLMHGRLFSGLGHGGGLRHGGTAGLHLLGILLMIAATIVLSAAATAGISEWLGRHIQSDDTTRVAAWVAFILVFGALGWLTLRVV